MFNSVAISGLDEHCHRFLWRNMETFRKPYVFVITAVNLGNCQRPSIVTVSLYLLEAEIVKKSSYVDEIIISVETRK